MILGHVPVAGVESVPLAAAPGRVLRRAVVSDMDYPRSDVSAMDGYCLDSRAAAGASPAAPVSLAVAGKSTPGRQPPVLAPGTCALIATGAPLARGADAVVKYEDVIAESGAGFDRDAITLRAPVAAGANVRKRGEVARKGDTVAEAGVLITPSILGTLAAFASGPFDVSRRPRACVLATGDELAGPGETPPGEMIRDSNSPALAAMLRAAGCEIAGADRCGDSEEEILARLEATEDCGMVVISGGISGGPFDFVPACLDRLGADVVFRGIRMRPGKTAIFAIRGSTVYFGVPGNPVSVVVAFHMLVQPAVLAMLGAGRPLPASIKATCRERFDNKWAHMTLTPGVLSADLTVKPARFLGSGDIMSLARANALVRIPDGVDTLSEGEEASVYLLEYPCGIAEKGA
jgi:molybdopterin molybdotransferase